MKKVFSFSLFGSNEKYWHGLYTNIELIHTYFPEWYIYVWVGDNVSDGVIQTLAAKEKVNLRFTHETGLINMSYRFFAIDDPDVELMCVRDADSRVNERDKACIEDFVTSEKRFHIIRDHPNHHHAIMGGMWGIKKGLFNGNFKDIFEDWRKMNTATEFWNDMDFLKILYSFCVPHAIIHDELQSFEPIEVRTPFRVALDEKKQHFIGQVYEFDSEGKEYPKYPYTKGG